VDGPAHQRDADYLSAGDQLGQVGGLEPLQPRPEAVIRRERRLRLQPDQVLHHPDHVPGAVCVRTVRERLAHQQALPGQERPVKRPRAQHV
jgi:hypothetical protein